MSPTYESFCTLLEGEPLPAALVDLDAFDRNLERVLEAMDPALTLRLATKSVRSPRLVARLLERGAGRVRGLLCYASGELEHLARRHGFDDLLLAYPVQRAAELERLARLCAEGRDVKVAVDSEQGMARLGRAARDLGTRVPVVVCVDMSLRLAAGRVHLGVRRSPLHDIAEVVHAARTASSTPGLTFAGLLAYEAQVAGLGDASPHQPWQNAVKRALRTRSARELGDRRAGMVEALRRAGLEPSLVNGGGTGSLDTTTAGTGVSEVAVGSAFFKPHLFDRYRSAYLRALEPAAFFALEITRRPGARHATCAGGGYVASGTPGWDKAPQPWIPRGLALLGAEGPGEVQTPLYLPRTGLPSGFPALGAPVLFRHAKAGELCERFNELLLVQGGHVVARAATYRGEGFSWG